MQYFLIFVLVYGVANAKLYGSNLMPFGASVTIALLYFGLNGYILSVIYMFAITLATLKINSVYIGLNVCLVLCLLQVMKSKKKFSLKKWQSFILLGLSQIVYIITSLGSVKENLGVFVSIVLSLLFLYSCMTFGGAILNRGCYLRLTIDEKISGAVIVIIFMLGMSATNIWIINLGLLFASLTLLICTYIFSGDKLILISAIIGVAFGINYMSPHYISLFVAMALFTVSLKCNIKYFSSISCVLSYIMFEVFFGFGIALGGCVSVCLGALIFSLVPLNVFENTFNRFDIKYEVGVRNIINNAKNQIVNRVNKLSTIFADMDKVYRDMVRGNLPEDKAKEMLREELILNVCSVCENYNYCYRASGNFVDNSIDTLISTAFEKGKIMLIDLPQYLSGNCNRINIMINSINSMMASYNEYFSSINNLDTSRILIANQLNGVSKLLSSLSDEVNLNFRFDYKYDSTIIEELMYKNVICFDVSIYEKDVYNKYVNLVIKSDTINEDAITKVVSKILKVKMQVQTIEESDINNASVVSLVTSPNYEVVYGGSAINKSGKLISGDSKCLIKIDDGKYMVSICDGMGSGNSANKISGLTISLIENFYKAGFDSDTIINSINKLLSLSEDEKFSTIDLCIIDAKKNTYDFIKLGATTSYLKRENNVTETIISSGLPVGVLEDVRPHTIKKLISPFDILIMLSDGVTDSFEGKLDLEMYISSLDIINPQTLSETILNKAIELSEGIARDDMTVICVRLFVTK